MKKVRVGVLSNSIYRPLIQNIDEVAQEFNYEIFRLSEAQITNFIKENRFDVILVNPYILSKVFKFADFRIIPTRVMASVSYTNQVSIRFRDNLYKFDELYVPDKEDYFTKIAQILLSERYDIFPSLKTYNNLEELEKSDCSLIYNDNDTYGQLDICEDFFETYEMPLLLGFWIVRNEEEPNNVKEFIERAFDITMNGEYPIYEQDKGSIIREGSIITNWNEDIKNSLEQVYQLLYFRQFINELPEIKIMS